MGNANSPYKKAWKNTSHPRGQIQSYLIDHPDYPTYHKNRKYKIRKRWKKNPRFLPDPRNPINIQKPVLKPALVDPDAIVSEYECGICHETANFRTFCCRQRYCLECLINWDNTKKNGKRNCPEGCGDYMQDKTPIKYRIGRFYRERLRKHIEPPLYFIGTYIGFLMLVASLGGFIAIMTSIILYIGSLLSTWMYDIIAIMVDPDNFPPSQTIPDRLVSVAVCLQCRVTTFLESACIQCHNECSPIGYWAKVCQEELAQLQS